MSVGNRTRRSAGRGSLAKMESDPALAKRLEDDLAQRAAFAKPEAEVVQSEVGANPSTRARQDEAAKKDSLSTGGASSGVTESDADMHTILANDRWIQRRR